MAGVVSVLVQQQIRTNLVSDCGRDLFGGSFANAIFEPAAGKVIWKSALGGHTPVAVGEMQPP
jgi:hypothetical protein